MSLQQCRNNWSLQVEGTSPMYQARMGHHCQMEDMQERKLTTAALLATIMVLLGSKLVSVMQHVCIMRMCLQHVSFVKLNTSERFLRAQLKVLVYILDEIDWNNSPRRTNCTAAVGP